MRVDISLTDVATGFEMWTYCYHGELDQMFAQRDAVSQSVGQGVGETLRLADPVAETRTLTDNREAYAPYLQGRAVPERSENLITAPTANFLATHLEGGFEPGSDGFA